MNHLNHPVDHLLIVSVSDTGIGMSQEGLENIFERFQQAETGISRKYGGTGLGLAISKELAQLFNGELSVESDLGKGTQFTLTIPVQQMEAQIAENHEIKLPHMTILLAEDNIVNQKVISSMLSQRGHYLVIASNGLEAIEEAKNKKFDLILMDMHMPEMDGIEATKSIRKNVILNQSSPIIAFTADVISEHQIKFKEAGVNGVITKPIMFDKLSQKIAEIINVNEIKLAD